MSLNSSSAAESLEFVIYNGAAFGSLPDILVGFRAGIADFAVL